MPPVNCGPGVAFWAGTFPDVAHVWQDQAIAASKVLANRDELAAAWADRRLWKAGFGRVKPDPIGYLVTRAQGRVRLWTPRGDFLLRRQSQSFKQAFRQGQYRLIAVKVALASVTSLIPIVFAVAGALAYRRDMIRLFSVWIPVFAVAIIWAPFILSARYVISAQSFISTSVRVASFDCGITCVGSLHVPAPFHSVCSGSGLHAV